MQDFNKECAASSDKGSEPVVLCSKMVRIAAAFLKETDPEGYEMLCEGLAKANPDSIAFINEHLLKGRTDDAEQADWDLPSLIIGHRLAVTSGRCAIIEPGADESPRGWRIRVKKGNREKVTKVWDRFSASDMRHDIKLPSVARLSEKERALLGSSARNGAPGTRAEAPSGPERGGRFGGRFGFDPLVSVYGNHQHREWDRKDRVG